MAVVTKTRRLEARMAPATDALLERASDLLGESRSTFVVRAVEERAERVLAQADQVTLSEAEFNALLASLDQAWPLTKLEKKARQARPYAVAG
ncbi:MAG: DUF1778 domain-containing protein [Propionibacteriaceae bacterium]|jgi:uncharacterized protein (DUF1778 family)|nr:DUF1778 domain-containing protein [Propionibacteriaceae bacterium]